MESKQIKTAEDAQIFLEGCVNDLQNGIMTKAEFMKEMAEYTSKIGRLARKPDNKYSVRDIAQIIANKVHMPYCWETVEHRLTKGDELPFTLTDDK